MIGSLLFYVMYPLSRYRFNRQSEATKKDLLLPLINGTALCDGGAVTARTFTVSQTTLFEQHHDPIIGMKGEMKELVKEPSPEKEDSTMPNTDKEQLISVLYDARNTETASKMSEVQPEVEEEEAKTRNGPQQAGPCLDSGEIIQHEVFDVKQNAECGCIFPSEHIDLEDKVMTQLKGLLKEDSRMQNAIRIRSLEESVVPAELSIQQTPGLIPKQTQMPSLTESVSPAEVTECWDKYGMLPEDSGESSKLLFGSHSKLSREHDAQPGWHFPAGPGLTQEVHCPLWLFPKMSYYPPAEAPAPFEVVWRVWEEKGESALAADPTLSLLPFSKASMDFTIMSYNILADDLMKANLELYTHCPLEVLDWSYRCMLILEEIMKWAPDILCLQEVQENHYYEHLYPFLSQRGYNCVYKRRTGTKTDGCATCYRSSCFSEVSVSLLEFYRPETGLLDRHNVGIVLLLRPVVTRGSDVKVLGPPLCLANTHLLFSPRRGDVKLAQLAIMLAEIDRVVRSLKAKGEHCNIILCGDFNSVPNMPLYQLITTGELYYHSLPAWMISGQQDLSYRVNCHRLFAPLWPSSLGISDNCQYTTEEYRSRSEKPGMCRYSHDFLLQLRFSPASCVRPVELELIPGLTDNTPDATSQQLYTNRRSIQHGLHLESVYSHILPCSGSAEVTTLHTEGGRTVDYIFYSPRHTSTSPYTGSVSIVREGLKLIGSLSLLSEDVLWSMDGLPNDIFPSDHLSLLAKFQMDLNAM